jgi:hypothetical protein
VAAELFLTDERGPLCLGCSPTCAACGKTVAQGHLRVQNVDYHAACLACAACQGPLTATVYERHNRPVCARCVAPVFPNRWSRVAMASPAALPPVPARGQTAGRQPNQDEEALSAEVELALSTSGYLLPGRPDHSYQYCVANSSDATYYSLPLDMSDEDDEGDEIGTTAWEAGEGRRSSGSIYSAIADEAHVWLGASGAAAGYALVAGYGAAARGGAGPPALPPPRRMRSSTITKFPDMAMASRSTFSSSAQDPQPGPADGEGWHPTVCLPVVAVLQDHSEQLLEFCATRPLLLGPCLLWYDLQQLIALPSGEQEQHAGYARAILRKYLSPEAELRVPVPPPLRHRFQACLASHPDAGAALPPLPASPASALAESIRALEDYIELNILPLFARSPEAGTVLEALSRPRAAAVSRQRSRRRVAGSKDVPVAAAIAGFRRAGLQPSAPATATTASEVEAEHIEARGGLWALLRRPRGWLFTLSVVFEDEHGVRTAFRVERTPEEFQLLRETLGKRFPTVALAPFPAGQRSLLRSIWDAGQRRVEQLNAWLASLLQAPDAVWEHRALQLFFRA